MAAPTISTDPRGVWHVDHFEDASDYCDFAASIVNLAKENRGSRLLTTVGRRPHLPGAARLRGLDRLRADPGRRSALPRPAHCLGGRDEHPEHHQLAAGRGRRTARAQPVLEASVDGRPSPPAPPPDADLHHGQPNPHTVRDADAQQVTHADALRDTFAVTHPDAQQVTHADAHGEPHPAAES